MTAAIDRLEAPVARRTVVACTAAFLVFACALAWCAVALADRDAAERDREARESLRAQAGDVVATVFTASAKTWDADRERASGLVAEPLSASVSTALRGRPPAGVESIRWQPLHVGVTAVDGDAGEAVVVVRATVVAGGHTTSRDKSVNATFTRTERRWLLNGLDELQ